MRADYRRDMDHNYLILEEESEVNTASYQVRMLVGNTVPCLLKCNIQGMDGRILFCYDITSRQSVSALFEKQKLGVEELQILFGGFVKAVEEMAESLLNPGHLVLDPAYIYLDSQRREVKFCYLPGYDHGIREQFQALTEYILPLLDHQDGKAVILGYGIYRRAMEDQFHMECVKEELYGAGKDHDPVVPPERAGKKRGEQAEDTFGEIFPGGGPALFSGEDKGKEKNADININDVNIKNVNEKGSSRKKEIGGLLLGCTGFLLVMLGIMAACMLGYLPWIEIEWILGITVAGMAAGCLISFLLRQKRKHRAGNEEEPWREKVRENLKQETDGKMESFLREGAAEAGRQGGSGNQQAYKMDGICRQEQGRTVKSALQEDYQEQEKPSGRDDFGETVVLCERKERGPATLVSREPGELATIYLERELTVVGKLSVAADAVIPLSTVSRVHARIRRRGGEYYLTDLNSRNGTSVNGIMLKGEEEYKLQEEDQVDFAQARYVFLK